MRRIKEYKASSPTESESSVIDKPEIQNSCRTSDALTQDKIDSKNIFPSLALQFRRANVHNDRKGLLNTTKGIRIGLSKDDNPPLDDFFETKVISDLVKLLDPDDKINIELQNEILWITSNACTGSDKQISKFLTRRLIEILLRFIWHPEQKLVEQTFWLIGNILGCAGPIREKLIQQDLLLTIKKFIKKSFIKRFKRGLTQENVRVISRILSNFALIENSYQQLLKYGFITMTEKFLLSDDPEICSNACATYRNFTNILNESPIEVILTSQFMKRIVELLESKNLNVLTPAIQAVGNILSSDSSHTIKMYSAGCLDKLECLIQHRKPSIRKYTLWAISNLIAEPNLLNEVIDKTLFHHLISIPITDVNPIKLEALICFINALNIANQKQIESIIELGFLRLLPMLMSNDSTDIILASLEALDVILRRGSETDLPTNPYLKIIEREGIVPTLEQLQTHDDDHVYSKVAHIIDTYFDNVEV